MDPAPYLFLLDSGFFASCFLYPVPAFCPLLHVSFLSPTLSVDNIVLLEEIAGLAKPTSLVKHGIQINMLKV